MRTSAELFADVPAGTVIDLRGEVIQGSDVRGAAPDIHIKNGEFLGQTQIHSASGMTFESCHFHAVTDDKLQGLLRMLGGNHWSIDGCSFEGGVAATQLGVGLYAGKEAPINWRVTRCTFDPLAGQWGTYPQGHNIYVLTDPGVNMGGLIEDCLLSGQEFGAALKLGGTGFQPRSEGCRGVLVNRCEISGVADAAGRCLAVLTEGAKTDVTLTNCTLKGDGAVPWVQGMDGALCGTVACVAGTAAIVSDEVDAVWVHSFDDTDVLNHVVHRDSGQTESLSLWAEQALGLEGRDIELFYIAERFYPEGLTVPMVLRKMAAGDSFADLMETK